MRGSSPVLREPGGEIPPGYSPGIAIQVEIPNRLKLLWSKATVVSVKEKTRLDLVRYVLWRRSNKPLITCRNLIGCH